MMRPSRVHHIVPSAPSAKSNHKQPPGSGTYVQIIPSRPDAKVLLSGDMTVTPGLWTRQVLAKGPAAFGKYANVALEKWTFKEMNKVWGEVTGKRSVYIPCAAESWTTLWGPTGNELALQFKFGEMCDPWEEKDGLFLGPADLGIDSKDVPGFRQTMEGLKHLF